MSDFLHPDGKVSLFHEDTPVRSDSSLLSSLYNYWLLSNDQSGKALTPSEIKARKTALKCIQVNSTQIQDYYRTSSKKLGRSNYSVPFTKID